MATFDSRGDGNAPERSEKDTEWTVLHTLTLSDDGERHTVTIEHGVETMDDESRSYDDRWEPRPEDSRHWVRECGDGAEQDCREVDSVDDVPGMAAELLRSALASAPLDGNVIESVSP